MKIIDDANTQCYRKYVFRGIESIDLAPKKCSVWQHIAEILVLIGLAKYH